MEANQLDLKNSCLYTKLTVTIRKPLQQGSEVIFVPVSCKSQVSFSFLTHNYSAQVCLEGGP